MSITQICLEDVGCCEAIRDYLNDNIGEIQDALDFSDAFDDEKTTIDNVKITGVELGTNNSIEIFYQYDWEYYHGCRDQRGAGHEESSIVGAIRTGALSLKPCLQQNRYLHAMSFNISMPNNRFERDAPPKSRLCAPQAKRWAFAASPSMPLLKGELP